MLNITIHQSGNSSQFPTGISAHVNTCTSDTWAATYAFDEAHARAVSSCVRDGEDGGPWMDAHGGMDKVLMTQPRETYLDDQAGRSGLRSGSAEFLIDRGSLWRTVGQPTTLRETGESQSVLVNLTM